MMGGGGGGGERHREVGEGWGIKTGKQMEMQTSKNRNKVKDGICPTDGCDD